MALIAGGMVPHMGAMGIGMGRGRGATVPNPSHIGTGKVGGIAAIAHGVGKPGNTEHLGNLFGTGRQAPKTSIAGGDPGMHSLNNYGKSSPLGGISGGVDPTAHGGMNAVRGAGMRQHIRQGALGPGMLGAAGPNLTNYSGMSFDQE